MFVTSTIIKKIHELQEINNILENKLLIFSFALSTNKAPVIKEVQLMLKASDDEINFLIDILAKEDLLNKKDFELLKRFKKKSMSISPAINVNETSEMVIEHLNQLTNSRRIVTPARRRLIEKWLNHGYSIEDFIHVNLYFYHSWHKNPDMAKFIRPETLYNTKFESRVEEAEQQFKEIVEYKKDIEEIYNIYQKSFTSLISKEDAEDVYFNGIPFEIQERISFWIKKGIKIKTIQDTIDKTIQQWSKKTELYSHINLMKILDAKFPERINIAIKIKPSNIDNLKEWANEN